MNINYSEIRVNKKSGRTKKKNRRTFIVFSIVIYFLNLT